MSDTYTVYPEILAAIKFSNLPKICQKCNILVEFNFGSLLRYVIA